MPSIALSPDNKMFAAISANSMVAYFYLWNFTSFTQTTQNAFVSGEMFHMLSYSKDGKYIAAANLGGGTVKIYNATTLNQLQNLVIGMGDVRCVDFSYDSQYILIAGNDPHIQVWSISNWTMVRSLSTNSTFSF